MTRLLVVVAGESARVVYFGCSDGVKSHWVYE